MSAWSRLGLRGRLAISIGAIVVLAFGAVFVVVRGQMANESGVIEREEATKGPASGESGGEADESSRFSTIKDAQSDVEKTFFLIGAAALVAALLAGYLLAARTAAPLRRFAETAAEVDAGDLSPGSTQGPRQRASCGRWPTPSTTCSNASRTPSPASGASSPTPRTSCAARSLRSAASSKSSPATRRPTPPR